MYIYIYIYIRVLYYITHSPSAEGRTGQAARGAGGLKWCSSGVQGCGV